DVVCASSARDGAQATMADVTAQGRQAWGVSADLSDRASVERMIADVDRIGAIDILVNNAGMIARAPAAEFSMEDWDKTLRTNLDAVWMLARHFGRSMIARGAGKIVNTASLLSFSGGITVPAYTASKHAV